VYVAGVFNGTATFGPTTLTAPTAPGTNNMFLAKYDSSGHVVFAQGYGATSGVNYTNPALAVDSAGNAFLGGNFTGTLALGGATAPIAAIGSDAFAAKISPTGHTLWADRFGYNAGPYAVQSIVVGPDGNPIVAGSATGMIVINGTQWPASSSGSQPFIAKLATADGSVVWSNASGGDISSSVDIFVATDSAGRVFVAARVDSGGGAWGVEPAAQAGTSATLRAGFRADGSIMWGQFDYGAFPVGAFVDSAGRLSVVENAYNSVTVGGGSTTFGGAHSGAASLSLLLSPIDGTLLSGLNIGNTTPANAAVDANGNTLFTGTYQPQSSPIPVGGLTLPAGTGTNQPLFVAALDGLSQAVGVATLGASNDAQPVAIAVDPASGNVFVAATLATAFTSSAGALQPGTFIAVLGPDVCNDGAGPLGPSTGNPSNHGDLGPDGGSPFMPDAAAPAPCPPDYPHAVNGAACPVPMGCLFGATCYFCTPMACNGKSTTWNGITPIDTSACPAAAPMPGAACSQSITCYYCSSGGLVAATCSAGGWSTSYQQPVCQ
jgi:hypothetical protein